jgi:hypothetical protein
MFVIVDNWTVSQTVNDSGLKDNQLNQLGNMD